jgi:hypothetical protein
MAKRRAVPQVVFDPAKRLPCPSGPVSLNIEGAIARRRSQIVSSGLANSTPAAASSPISDQSATQVLKRPGELERVIERITEGFRQADLSHRAAIDQQVMESFRVAGFLKHNWRGGERLLGGEWVKFWGKNGRNGDAALRFIFKKVHPDAKKASFYYRATRKLFEEGVRSKDVPARVTAAGGYQELADMNVESPRGKAATPPVADVDKEGNHFDADLERTKKPRANRKAQTSEARGTSAELQSEANAGDQSRLVTIMASDGIAFFDLPLPCSVTLNGELSQDSDGKWLMRVVSMKQID